MELFVIGVVGKPYGIKGYLHIRSLSGETSHFLKLKKVIVRNKQKVFEVNVEDVKRFNKNIIMKFDGIDNPEDGRFFQTCEILVSREGGCPLKKDEYYCEDLSGCKLKKDGRILGVVKSVCEGGNSDFFEIVDQENRVHIVPFIGKFIGKIDIKNKSIELKEDWIIG